MPNSPSLVARPLSLSPNSPSSLHPLASHATSYSPACMFTAIFKTVCTAVGGLGLLGLGGCSSIQSDNPSSSAKAATHPGKGQLEIRANGEDFVRNGFTSKDGWAITFKHLYVGLAEVTALQTHPSFDPDNGQAPKIKAKVEHSPITVVDLASSETPTALVAQFPQAQAGRYNALAWSIVPASNGPSQGQSLRLVGQASKGVATLAFTLDWDSRYDYLCGDFIGDQRKGILKAGDRAELEATFHFDHVFGDGDSPPTDAVNQTALGFSPLAALAEDGTITTHRSDLQSQLSPADFSSLEVAIAGLAHVGEGHCRQITAASSGEEALQ